MKSSAQAGIAVLLLSVASMLIAEVPASAQAYTLTTLASFNGSNGWQPHAGLILSAGTLYGTTELGGDLSLNSGLGCGTVFSVPVGGGAITALAIFNGSNGVRPAGGLVLSGGALYGTTFEGGDISLNNGYGLGTVFSVPAAGGAVTTLATFNGSNGQLPAGGLILSGGTLYGTTENGGPTACGTVFSVPVAGGEITTLATLNSSNGALSISRLILSGGTLYGTTIVGGDNSLNRGAGFGAVFSAPAAGGVVTTLATFDGSNGSQIYPGVILSGGTLYGAATYGGAYDDGTVFSVPVGGGAVTTLATFDGGNGMQPAGGLILSGGTLYGTTQFGGDISLNDGYGFGTVFSVPAAGGAVTTLAAFDGNNGAYPGSSLILSGGTFYGTTQSFGAHGYGTVFALTPTQAGSTYALWLNSGQASLWKIPASGSVTSAYFGPYSGWTPAALASDTSGNAYILWNSINGTASVWKVATALKITASQSFGPYTGWTAKSLAVGPDGNVHLLWNHTSDNAASIFNITLGSSMTSQAYGPFKGWQATQIAVDSNNNMRILWTDTSLYEASLWNITSSGTQTSQTFGPYSGWQAQSLVVDTNNQARVLWENTSTKQASISTVASDGSVTSKAFGPYSSWTPTGLAVNNDGDSDLMWNSASNQLSIFDIGSTGSFTSSGYGPYIGWKAIGIASGP